MLYSVKMRSAQGGAHEKGGRHISGAERILSEEQIETAVIKMLRRAKNHQRGEADFVSVKVEAIKPEDIVYQDLLPFSCVDANCVSQGHEKALDNLVKSGVTLDAATKGLVAIDNLRDSIRGAMLLDAETGMRLDSFGDRGVRVSKMDSLNSSSYEEGLKEQGLNGDHVREALVLASKVAAAPEVVAELCWSDDPGYVTGYVASKTVGYVRIPVMKETGNPVGGRVFFVRPKAELPKLINYLQEQVVLIKAGDEKC